MSDMMSSSVVVAKMEEEPPCIACSTIVTLVDSFPNDAFEKQDETTQEKYLRQGMLLKCTRSGCEDTAPYCYG